MLHAYVIVGMLGMAIGAYAHGFPISFVELVIGGVSGYIAYSMFNMDNTPDDPDLPAH